MRKTLTKLLTKPKTLLRPSRVDDVVAQFDATVASLKRIAEESKALAAKHNNKISKLEQERLEAMEEATRASSVAEKINALLS